MRYQRERPSTGERTGAKVSDGDADSFTVPQSPDVRQRRHVHDRLLRCCYPEAYAVHLRHLAESRRVPDDMIRRLPNGWYVIDGGGHDG